MFDATKMPKSVNCYICGRGYGTKSIFFHLKSCQKKWEIEQEGKPKKLRRACPQPPINFMNILQKEKVTQNELDQINQKAFDNYNQFGLVPCAFCNRSFNSKSYQIHQKMCTLEKPFMPLKKENFNQNTKTLIINKKTNYRSQSSNIQPKKGIEIQTQTDDSHFKKPDMKSSLNLPTNQNGKPALKYGRNDIVRVEISDKKILPQKRVSGYSVKKQSTVEFDIRETQPLLGMDKCQFCGRNFAIERINKHQQVCQGQKKAKKVKRFHELPPKTKQKNQQNNKWKQQHQQFQEIMKQMQVIKKAEKDGIDIKTLPIPKTTENPDLIQCKHCTRKFNPQALERHEKICQNVFNKPKPVTKNKKIINKK